MRPVYLALFMSNYLKIQSNTDMDKFDKSMNDVRRTTLKAIMPYYVDSHTSDIDPLIEEYKRYLHIDEATSK